MKKLTIGILAHVDAGKTTLSEGLLYAAGALRTMMVSPDFDVAAQEALKEQKRGTRG